MTHEELADSWDREAEVCRETAENTRSLDLSVREHVRASQLHQCAMQLRLVTGNARRNAARDAATTPTIPPPEGNDL